MKAAVPFENGRIFQHFGKTSAFLVAEIELFFGLVMALLFYVRVSTDFHYTSRRFER